ncbi:PAS domain S-box protein [Undibacterium sp. LX40W]|uniref:histidine kinase n=1 Tax=Undibacterium nitidum TaxID=2762298 RepID=A0A923HSH0_9BURK|nr:MULTISPECIES: ATP-binding protein [Undibacterium]MBC3882485.1 PAS domain S-box protein [Undibacterium nitidum]MBC3892766.1 PAS domain S-box protein [Undibacterium sp. LX40W]
MRALFDAIHLRRVLPYRMVSQLMFLVGVAVALSSLIAGSVFTYASIKRSREVADEQVLYLGKSISSISTGLLINRDVAGLEDLLRTNARLPYIQSILIADVSHRPVTSVIKRDGKIMASYDMTPVMPTRMGEVQSMNAETGSVRPMLFGLIQLQEQYEIWLPIEAGTQIGALRLRYSIEEVNSAIMSRWAYSLMFALVLTSAVLLLLYLLLRAPMQALANITAFASLSAVKASRQIPVYAGTKEIYELSTALNRLSITIRSHEQNLSDRMAQNQTILDNLADGILVLDSDGSIRSCNVAVSRIFGGDSRELLGQNIERLIPSAAVNNKADFLYEFVERSHSKLNAVGMEIEACRLNGERFPADLALSKTTDHGEPIFIGIIRDISERRRLDRLKSEFVATVSHELRTPLTSIHGSLKLVENGVLGELPPEAKKLVGLAQKNSSRLILLINDLLDMEKLVAGKMPIQLVDLDLVNAVKQSVADNAGYASQYHVQYAFASGLESLPVHADTARLAQVLANILSNAAKFSNGSPKVDVRVSRSNSAALVEIEDYGQGIPIDFQSEIFNAFAQANNGNTRQQGGTGLGLKISKALVHAMGGEIGFSTQEGLGTTFWFTLPLAYDDTGAGI